MNPMNKTLPSCRRLISWHRLQALPLAFGLLSLTLAHPAIAQDTRLTPGLPLSLKTLSVTGRGMQMIPTTIAQVRLGVEVQGKTATAVQQDVARRSSAVVELLRSRNVEQLQTTGISLNPTYSYENNVQRLTGFTATNTVSFRTGNQQAGTLLDDAVKAGATRIDGINFVATDSAIATAQQQALRLATQDAQRQADTVLGALNFTRKEVVSIQVNGASAPPPPPFVPSPQARLSAADASTPVVGGEQQVEGFVTLQISY
jgi:hypothetical protein